MLSSNDTNLFLVTKKISYAMHAEPLLSSSPFLSQSLSSSAPLTIVLDPHSYRRLIDGRSHFKWLCPLISIAATAAISFLVLKTSPDRAQERSITAALSFVLSLSLFVWFACSYLSLALAFQYALRGATVGVFATVVLESWSQSVLASSPPLVALPAIMFGVGFAEEGGKLLSLLFHTALTLTSLNLHAGGCLGVWCQSLVAERRGLLLLGICVGFGFMLTENLEYFYIVNISTDPTNSANTERFGRIVTGLLRSFLNLHPLLTGWVAARLGKKVYSREDRQTHAGDWLHALWPSAMVHGAYDLAVTVVPNLVGGELLGEFIGLAIVALVWGAVLGSS